MMNSISYKKALELLQNVSTPHGFLASSEDTANYQRIWARDGVICGLASLLDGDLQLINTFKNTLLTLANYQHPLGHIPSNVFFSEKQKTELSYGGLAGRVDTISWFIIGVCNYSAIQKDASFLEQMLPHIEKGLQLLEAWEFNNNHLVYVPRSGNWADEYITEGHTFYDQVLRIWALRCVQSLRPSNKLEDKIAHITAIVDGNYKSGNFKTPYHPKAYTTLTNSNYWAASINPSGYQTMYDAFGNSLALLLDLGTNEFQSKVIAYSEKLRESLAMKLLPAFWDPITEKCEEWKLLVGNCKYEFRNYPYEFHNGGTWQMVNGFYGIGVFKYKPEISKEVLVHISRLNSEQSYGFYENFHTITQKAIGTKYCSWSAAAEIILTQYSNGKKFLI
ncbi:glycoside hydrolase 100 family protein [Aquimarina sp. W85]|uniref:glycoside hydrolase 100 family protein n=1 Tax=Aquimarina rhodophyticola TaxID=3342246 RepID=UPI00366D31D3